MNSVWHKGEATWISGASPQGAHRWLGLAPSLPAPCQLPEPSSQRCQQWHPSASTAARPRQHHRHMQQHFPYRKYSLKPHTNKIPQNRKRGLKVLWRHKIWKLSRGTGELTSSSGALPNPFPAWGPTGTPLVGLCCCCWLAIGWGSKLQSACLSLPTQVRAMPGTQGKKAKDRPSPGPLPRWGG